MKLKKKIKIIGLGSGGHARVLLDILKKDKRYLFMGLLDKKKNNFSNIPILGTDKDLSKIYNQGIKNCFIGFSDIKNTSINLSIFNLLKNKGFQIINIISESSIISESVVLGEGIKILAGAIINSNTRIGDNVLINTGAIVDHDCNLEDHVQIGPGVVLGGNVTIQEGSFVGLGSRIKQGIFIGKKSIIGAGSVVVKDIQKNSIVAGVPARKIGENN
jgi:UDP-perosamine 4-acetyltransferase